MPETYEVSRAAHERLRAELEQLLTHGRTEIARKIEAARELGDLSENGDYHAAKEEQGKMEARIGHLQKLLENATIIDDDAGAEVVRTGCVVTIVYEGDDEEERYLIGLIEERHEDLDVISPSSPLGTALLGASVGATVEFEAPTGAQLRVEVRAIEA
jgi:transcription elongation factor GreA